MKDRQIPKKNGKLNTNYKLHRGRLNSFAVLKVQNKNVRSKYRKILSLKERHNPEHYPGKRLLFHLNI